MDNNGRLASLDALRGFDMWFITGGAPFLAALGWFLTGDQHCWIAVQMKHVEWEGLRIYDLIFPLFLFISGAAFPFSLAKRRAAGATNAQILRHVAVRTFWLVVFGLVFYSQIQRCDWPTFRVWSVIGRVGISWAAAAAMWTFWKPRTCAVVTAAILLAWWIFLAAVPAPTAPDGVLPMAEGKFCFADWFDSQFLTTAHRHEGGLATLAMPPLTMMGIFAGEFLRSRGDLSGNRRALVLAVAAVALAAAGIAMATCFGSLSMPIVKPVYSSSYSLVACGIACALLALFHWTIDVRGWRAWSFYFRVIGANALVVYLSQPIVPWRSIGLTLMGALTKSCANPAWQPLCAAFGQLATAWLVLLFLYRRKIFVRV